eukprot:scaffold59332_cov26-Tisochrysis_lutea.AAC.1
MEEGRVAKVAVARAGESKVVVRAAAGVMGTARTVAVAKGAAKAARVEGLLVRAAAMVVMREVAAAVGVGMARTAVGSTVANSDLVVKAPMAVGELALARLGTS